MFRGGCQPSLSGGPSDRLMFWWDWVSGAAANRLVPGPWPTELSYYGMSAQLPTV